MRGLERRMQPIGPPHFSTFKHQGGVGAPRIRIFSVPAPATCTYTASLWIIFSCNEMRLYNTDIATLNRQCPTSMKDLAPRKSLSHRARRERKMELQLMETASLARPRRKTKAQRESWFWSCNIDAKDSRVSCQSCRKKKAKCSRRQPCSQCVRFSMFENCNRSAATNNLEISTVFTMTRGLNQVFGQALWKI